MDFSLCLHAAQGRSSDSLDAFYVGRAIAEVLRESLGSGLLELLSELARRDAILRKELRYFSPVYILNDYILSKISV